MQGLEIHAYQYLKAGNTVRGGGTQFPRELSPVNWFCTTRELGPGTVFPRELGPGGGTVFPKGIRSAGPKIGPDRIPYDTGANV